MKFLIILLVFITIILALLIIYFNGYNKLSIIKAKMDSANDIISKTLKDKQKLMNELYILIKKVIKKKDYLKDFNSLNNKKLTNYELDIELNNNLKIMKELKEDNKELNTNEYNEILTKIEAKDEILIANKKYYNKNNNLLSKTINGYLKIIAKINHVKIQTSYELK
ncbi:MAG: hypothetical protein PUD07_04605 [bacterium]|nr:hypothetical protein [bacterium]